MRITEDLMIFIPVFVRAKPLTLIHPLDFCTQTATGSIPESAERSCQG